MAPVLASPTAPADAGRMSLGLRKQGLADMLEGKLEQGYGIEDRTDTEATLVENGRRRRQWFGRSQAGEQFKQRISIDEDGVRASRKL